MRVNVGSTNPVKVKATANVLGKIFDEIEVRGVEVDSGVSDQPVGLEETVKGAINRARGAFSNCELSVGIESGLHRVPGTITGFVDLQWCAIYDGDHVTLGVSAGFEYPPLVVEEVLSGREVGEVMDELTGVDELGRKRGAVSFLSHGMLDRVGNTEQCVLMAMIPRMNPSLYDLE
ncbi:inosine/xanthosine triphosphatase [Methanothermobacter sp.]|uniref:inosine/xanthosine triphosphatase n=1 Tax=Methanothermobacter sp. TaxID=1884223 RepID=UPI00261390F3|nr:inosine/xanthosine triphosphatase [Methanothermobacter sp.]MDI9618684.1 inosine/xanthosine triphosphatase [Methanothermobacter sp.]